MKVAVLGGTGSMGFVLAGRLSASNEVVIGSRDVAKAKEAASRIPGATGEDYRGACLASEAAIMAVPFSSMKDVARPLSSALAGKLVISIVNPLRVEGGVFKFGLEGGSAAETLASVLPDSWIATAFNNIPYGMFEGAAPVEADVLVAATSKDAYETTASLVKSIKNLRPLYAGPISEAQVVERITALVLNLARMNGIGSLATRFVSMSA